MGGVCGAGDLVEHFARLGGNLQRDGSCRSPTGNWTQQWRDGGPEAEGRSPRGEKKRKSGEEAILGNNKTPELKEADTLTTRGYRRASSLSDN